MWKISASSGRGIWSDYSDQHFPRKLWETSQDILHRDGTDLHWWGKLNFPACTSLAPSITFQVGHFLSLLPQWDLNSEVTFITKPKVSLFLSKITFLRKNIFRTLLILNIYQLKKLEEIANSPIIFKSFTNIYRAWRRNRYQTKRYFSDEESLFEQSWPKQWHAVFAF